MLRNFLWANCISCAAFGILFLFNSLPTAQFIGSPPVLLIRAVGAVLILNAVMLAYTAIKLRHIPIVILFFVVGDIGWVVFTATCLIFGIWIEGSVAIFASLVVAFFVGGLGIGQYIFGVLRNERNSSAQ